jgi:urease accessory protein
MNTIEPDISTLLRLLQLVSPALPIGGYSYSQGLEWKIETRVVVDADSAKRWIADVLEHVMTPGEAAILLRLYDARMREDAWRFQHWNDWYRTSRESRELRAETEQMGASLTDLARNLGVLDATSIAWIDRRAIVLPAAFALSAFGMKIPREAAIGGYIMSWLENQVLAAVKTLPLGQVAGQRILFELASRISQVVERVGAVPDDDVVSFAPGFALASMRHETQ